MRNLIQRHLPTALALALMAVLSVTLAVPAFADELTVLKLKDGRTVEGTVAAESDTSITLMLSSGTKVVYEKEQVVERTNKKSVREIYAEKRAKLANDDQDGRYTLVRDLYINQHLDLAKQEIDILAKDFPDNEQVKVLRRLIDEALKPVGTETTGTATPTTAVLLTPEQINLLRVYELDYGSASKPEGPDAKAKLVVEKDLYDALIQAYRKNEKIQSFLGKDGRAKFQKMTAMETLDLLFTIQAKDLYTKVEVKTEPASLREFRTKIYGRYVLKYFATYFAAEVPGLVAKTAKPAPSDQEAYTSFVALMDAVVGKDRLIDRAHPEQSLLLQWGLPADEAVSPAPAVKGWKPCFKNKNDPDYKEIVKWIDSLYGDAPIDYGIQLVPAKPSEKGTDSTPATTPSPTPAPASPAS